MAGDAREVVVPAGNAHVELVLVREVDGAHGASCRRRAEAAAGHDVRVAEELLAVRRKRRRVLVEGCSHVDARLQRVDDMLACACGVGSSAQEDLYVLI